jgi:hypothetical protein
MKNFEREFTKLKPTQRIEWRKAEGVVTLSISLNGKETEFRLSPAYVEVLGLFTPLGVARSAPASTVASHSPIGQPPGSRTLSLEEMATLVKLPFEQIRPVVQFWVSKNVLREVQINQFALITP